MGGPGFDFAFSAQEVRSGGRARLSGSADINFDVSLSGSISAAHKPSCLKRAFR
jgi:hypothetical protein